MRRLPNNAVAKALVTLLSAEMPDIPVTDCIDESVSLPYISIGSVMTADDRVKSGTVMSCKIQIHIWSDYEGKSEVDGIAQRIAETLQADDTVIDMSDDDFAIVDGGIESYDTYEEDTYGYNGIINLSLIVEDIKNKED